MSRRKTYDASAATTCMRCGLEVFVQPCSYCANAELARKQDAAVIAAMKHEQDLGKEVTGMSYDEATQMLTIHAAWSLVNHDPGDEDRT